jgi:hypothetical protein
MFHQVEAYMTRPMHSNEQRILRRYRYNQPAGIAYTCVCICTQLQCDYPKNNCRDALERENNKDDCIHRLTPQLRNYNLTQPGCSARSSSGQ